MLAMLCGSGCVNEAFLVYASYIEVLLAGSEFSRTLNDVNPPIMRTLSLTGYLFRLQSMKTFTEIWYSWFLFQLKGVMRSMCLPQSHPVIRLKRLNIRHLLNSAVHDQGWTNLLEKIYFLLRLGIMLRYRTRETPVNQFRWL